MQIDRVNPLDLTFADIVAWRRFVEAQPVLSSPFLTPEWAQAVARRRPDAEVVVFRKGARPVGYLPVQRPNAFAALPLGGVLNERQALIGPSDPSYDLAEAVHALDVGRIDFTCALAQSGLGRTLQTRDAASIARFDTGWEGYVADLKAAGSNRLVDAVRALRSLTGAHPGGVRLDAFSTDADAFEQLIAWRRADLAASGATDIFQHAWISGLVRDTFDAPRTSTFGGALFVLRIGGRPAAALYCLTARHALHAWISGQDPAFADASAGLCNLVAALRDAHRAGFTEMDIGQGVEADAIGLANAGIASGAGYIGRPGVAATMRSAEFGLRALLEGLPVGGARAWPARAMRRMDIAAGVGLADEPRPGRAA
jgi:CelD/BcsL family acetyltransferase involved in cellulose biosynthesis